MEAAATVPGAAGGRGAWGGCGQGQVRCPAQVTHAGEIGGTTAHTMATVLQAPEGPQQAWGWVGIHPYSTHYFHCNPITSDCLFHWPGPHEWPCLQGNTLHMLTPVSIVTVYHSW